MTPGMLVMGASAAPYVIGPAVLRRVADTQWLHVGCTPSVRCCRRMRDGLLATEIAP